jgi:DNA polymerase theta
MINGAIKSGTIGNLKSVVLDELHMIDDSYRGYLLELLSAKLLSLEQDV